MVAVVELDRLLRPDRLPAGVAGADVDHRGAKSAATATTAGRSHPAIQGARGRGEQGHGASGCNACALEHTSKSPSPSVIERAALPRRVSSRCGGFVDRACYPGIVRWPCSYSPCWRPRRRSRKPKAAVAPLDGDDDQKVAKLVADAAGDHAKVTGPERVAKAMDNLSITSFKSRDLKKLRSNLEVDVDHPRRGHEGRPQEAPRADAVGQGQAEGDARARLQDDQGAAQGAVAARSARSSSAAAGGGNDDDADDDDDARASARSATRPPTTTSRRSTTTTTSRRSTTTTTSRRSTRRRRQAEEARERRRRPAQASTTTTARRSAPPTPMSASTATTTTRSTAQGSAITAATTTTTTSPTSNPITQAAAWVDAGGNFTRHTLTLGRHRHDEAARRRHGRGCRPRSRASCIRSRSRRRRRARASASTATSAYAMGLGIAVPGAGVTAPIKQEHYEIGARYRIAAGQASIAFGAAYWRRSYIADRSKLMMPTAARHARHRLQGGRARHPRAHPGRAQGRPRAVGRHPADARRRADREEHAATAPRRSSPPTSSPASRSCSRPHYALQLRGDFNYDSFSFAAKAQSGAATRGVTSATEMNYGVTATIGVLY